MTKKQMTLAKFVGSLIPAINDLNLAHAAAQRSANECVANLAIYGDFAAPEAGVSLEASLSNSDRDRLVRALRSLADAAVAIANDLDTVEIVGK